MMHQSEKMSISKVRGIVKQIVREEPTPLDVVQAARDTVQTLCQEAARYGLTTSDVLRAVLHPVFVMSRGCDCSGCKARRNEFVEEYPLDMRIPVA